MHTRNKLVGEPKCLVKAVYRDIIFFQYFISDILRDYRSAMKVKQ